MKIEDEELRSLFQAESEEHLQRMDQGLLRLEQEPQNRSMLEEVYREAHSLKGAARMIGVRDVETVAHRFEDLLGPAKRGQAELTSDLVDRLSQVLDGIRRLVDQAITGNPSGVDVVQLLDSLNEPDSRSASEKSPIASPPLGKPPTESLREAALPTGSPDPGKSQAAPTSTQPKDPDKVLVQESSSQSETIRVDSKRLDVLMRHAGELTVTKSRLDHRMSEIEQLRFLRDSWKRDLPQHRVVLATVEELVNTGVGGALQQFYRQQQSRLEEFGHLLDLLAKEASEDQQRLESLAYHIDEGVRNARLLPFSVLFERYRRTVRDIGRELGKTVNLVIEGGDSRADKQVLDELKAPLMHVVRNAMDHGIESQEERARVGKSPTGTVRLSATQRANTIVVTVSDDGRGLDVEAIKHTALRQEIRSKEELDRMTSEELHSLVLASGFSTRKAISDISGRGIGMDVVRATVERLKGTMRIHSTAGKGCEIFIEIPVTLSTMRVLILYVHQNPYAIPLECVEGVRLVPTDELIPCREQTAMTVNGENLTVMPLSELLEVQGETIQGKRNGIAPIKDERERVLDQSVACVILKVGTHRMGYLVDTLGEEQEVVLKPYSTLLKRVRNVSGCTILGTGEICTILNPSDLLRSAQQRDVQVPTSGGSPTLKKPTILLVDDSLTIRAKMKGKLEEAGYEVVTAVDGIDGWNRLKNQSYDAVISDVQMPRLDGFGLTATIRKEPKYSNLPIILFTSLSEDEAKLKAEEAGANAYVQKTELAEVRLLETLRQLL